MPPKPTWKHKGFYEEKKHQRNEFPPRHHGFYRFQQAHGGGPRTLGGGGARNQFLEDPSHNSGSGSYARTTKPYRDPKPQFFENVSNRHSNRLLASPSQAHSMNTPERLHCTEQLYVDNDHNKKHERESSMGLKPFNKWKCYGRFYSGRVMSDSEGTRKRPRLTWDEELSKLQKKKTESDGESVASVPTSVSGGYSSLSGLKTLTDGDASGSESNGRNTRAPRDPRPQFWANVTQKHFDNVLNPPSHIDPVNTRRMFQYGKQHYHNDHNKNNEGESSLQLNMIKRWSRSKGFYYGDTGKEKDKNMNVLGEGSNEIEETRKRPRLNWGDGLAKFEKKKRDVEGVSATSAADSTPTSVSCSSLSGLNPGQAVETTKLEYGAVRIDPCNAVANALSIPPGEFCFAAGVGDILHAKTAMEDHNKVDILSASVIKLLESADLSSSLGRSNAMTKVLIWKTIISKVLDETQKKISSLENELKTMQSESQSGHNPEALPIAPSNIETRPLSPHLHDSGEDTLCKTIISCNREIVERSSAAFDNFCPTKCHKVMCSSSLSHENAVIKEKFAEKAWFGRFKEKVLITKYKALDHLWKKDMLLRSLRKNSPTCHSNFEPSLRTITSDCHRNRSSTRHRFPFPGKKLSLVPTSEMINFTNQLLSESPNEAKKSILKMPSLILDEKDKMISMFKSRNGVVEDPVAVEKERAMINPWTSEERKIYLEKFKVFGKDFRKVASFLDHKTTADCVEFYYRSHKLDCFEKDKKRKSSKSEKLTATKTGFTASGRKRNLKLNVDSQKKLSETPQKKRAIACNRRTRSGRHFLWRTHEDTKISTGDDIITCRSNSNRLGVVVHERERVSTDVLVDLCDSLLTDPVDASCDEVNVVKTKSDTNKTGDRRNLNQDEPQHVEDIDVSEPTKIISMVSNESIIVENIVEEGDETMKFVPASKVVESLVNEVNGTRVEVSVVEAKLDTNKNDDERNLNRDEFQPVEDGNVSESMEIMNMVSNECVTMKEIMEMGDEVREVASAYEIVESPVIEVNGIKDEVNAGEAKPDTSKNEDHRNLNYAESKPAEDRNVSESTKIISMVSNECIIIQDIMEDGDENTEFVPASEVVESPGTEVNIVEHESYTNKIEDERNLSHDESQLVEDGIVSESKEASMVSSDCIIMQNIVEVGGEVIEFGPTFEMVESLVHEVNGSRDAINVVEAKSDTKPRGDQRNLNLDESQLNEEGDVSELMEIVSMFSNKCIINIDEGQMVTKFVPTFVIVESPVNEVNDARDEVNVVEAKSDINEKDDQRNLNRDVLQLDEDGNVSDSTKIISFVSSDCTVMHNIMKEEDKVTKLVPASVIVESPVNEVNDHRDEVNNVVEPKSDTNKKEDQRNLNHDEFQPLEDRKVSELTEIISIVSSDIVMQNIMEEGDKVTEFVPASSIVESPVNEVNDPEDEVNVVEAKSETNKKEEQKNLNRDEFQPVEDMNVSESTEMISIVSSDIVMQNIMKEEDKVIEFVPTSVIVESPVNEVNDHRDEVNNVVEPKSDTNKKEDQRNLNHDEFQPLEDRKVSESTEIISIVSSDIVMQNIMEEGDKVTEFEPAFIIVESPVNEVNDPSDEVNVVEAKSETNKKEEQKNLNRDEFQPGEGMNVSESTEMISIVSSDIVMQNIMKEEDKVIEFVPTSLIVESPMNEVNDAKDEVNVVEAKSDINEKDDQRNLNRDELQLEEDGNVSESTEIISFVSSDCTVMHNIMEEEDKVSKLVPASVIVESPVNEVNDHRDEVNNVVEPKSDTNKKEDQRNLNHDEFQPLEDRKVSESTEIISIVSSDIVMQNIMEEGDKVTEFVSASVIVESPENEVKDPRDEVNVMEEKSDNDKKDDQRNLKHDEFQSVEDRNELDSKDIVSSVIIMQNTMEEGDKVTEFVPASVIVEFPVNEVNDPEDEVSIVEGKSGTSKKDDQRNLNNDEFESVEDRINVSESIDVVSSDIVMQNTMEEGDKVTEFEPVCVIESPVNEVNDPSDEVNVVEVKSETNKKEDQRNLNHDEFQPVEDMNVSESTEIISIVSSDVVMQNIMEKEDKVTEFVPTSIIVESPVNEVNVVEEKLDTNKKKDKRNLNHDEVQPMEDRNVSESSKIISIVSGDIVMQNIMEEGDKVTEFVSSSEIVESPVNEEVNDPSDEVNVVEAKSNTNKKEDQSNLNHDEFQHVEDRNVSESSEIISIVSSDIVMQNIMEENDKVSEFVPASEIVESPLNEVTVDRDEVKVVDAKSDINENEDQCNLNHDESQPTEGGNVSETTETINMFCNEGQIMQDLMELEEEVTKLVPASETVEPCQTHSVAGDVLVSEKLAELPTCLDGKCEYDSNLVTDGYGVVLYNSDKCSSVSDERATIMPNMMEVRGVVAEVESTSRIIVSCQTHSAAEEDILVSENTLLQNTVGTSVQQEITTLQPQDGNDNDGNDEHDNPGISLKDPVDREVKADIGCSSSSAATGLPQSIEQSDGHSETAATDGVVFKLFGKIIIAPSSVEKHDVSVNENGERGERPLGEALVHELVARRERPKRRVSEPKYLKDYIRFK
ncbi:hypothetical protein VNO80_13452 [Phaseolus coccineus]|uniref:SANT domain-containing protein n=1 Tax=Phaseolus coccineus TaxID=3886 RepID=A0AAN9N1P7_PHACN